MVKTLYSSNIVFEYRYADGKLDRLPEIAAELVRSDVALIVTASTPATQAVRKASSTIPILVMTAGDLVGSRLVASLATGRERHRPDGNVTGPKCE
jgi:putative tryptophan/tyrosine transport system substrate-binding protein